MKSMTDILVAVLGLIAFVVAIWQFAAFATFKNERGLPDMWAGTNHLWLAIAAAIIACICAVAYFVRNHKEMEEIHISK
ncbi:MAG TPA: hypothetical protein VF666_17860 [Pyrinomonadaceae bacterium]|jgi:uncharacterized membrane protein